MNKKISILFVITLVIAGISGVSTIANTGNNPNVKSTIANSGNNPLLTDKPTGCLDDLEASLPDQVTVLFEHAYLLQNFDESYFKATIDGTSLDGIYLGWCVDTDHLMSMNSFLANVYSSVNDIIPADIIEKPYNLDLVNYIINQHYVGKPSSCTGDDAGDFTYGDVQRAIWALIEDHQSSIVYLGPWKQCRVDEILADANANGEGFKPDCDQVVAIILEPTEIIEQEGIDIGQVGIIEVLLTSEQGGCRWTGGGTIGDKRDPRSTHGFELHCNINQLPNNLEVNWGGDHFHLEVLTQVECSDDPNIEPNPPRSCCDTIHGWGDGKYNNIDGYHIEFIFTDAGEPGKDDSAWIKITDSIGGTIMEVSGLLDFGNQQSHCLTGIDLR